MIEVSPADVHLIASYRDGSGTYTVYTNPARTLLVTVIDEGTDMQEVLCESLRPAMIGGFRPNEWRHTARFASTVEFVNVGQAVEIDGATFRATYAEDVYLAWPEPVVA